MDRRSFLRAGGGLAATAVAGCLEGVFETQSVYAPPPVVEDRPDAVYVPTHTEGMEMIGTATEKWYTVGLMFSFPHRFWNVTSRDTQKVTIGDDDSIHLMASLWDTETETVPPNANLRVEIERDGERVVTKPLWPMLSQNMGYHFGDNVALSRDGTYTVTVRVGPIDARRTGNLRGQFGESASFTVTFDYSQEQRDEISFEELPERKGQPGALDPMEMELPSTQLPPGSELPGSPVGEAESGDGRFLVRRLDAPPEGIDGSDPYLAVSPRTPYNRHPLPFMSLSGTIERDGNAVFEGALSPTIDPGLGYHYGTVADARPGDALALTVDTPPQVSRHEGYETAFFDTPPMEFSL